MRVDRVVVWQCYENCGGLPRSLYLESTFERGKSDSFIIAGCYDGTEQRSFANIASEKDGQTSNADALPGL